MKARLPLLAVLCLTIGLLSPATAAQGFNAYQTGRYESCEDSLDPEMEFRTVKAYLGSWHDIFINREPLTGLFCGENTKKIKHGYTHIRIRHGNEWKNELNDLRQVAPRSAPDNWQDLMDMTTTGKTSWT